MFTKEEVLKYKTLECFDNDDCPKNVKCRNDLCNTRFFCQNDDCLVPSEKMTYEYNLDINTCKSSNGTEIILESCPEEARNQEKCFTRYCETNDNCYSLKCINSTCIANETLSPMYIYFIQIKCTVENLLKKVVHQMKNVLQAFVMNIISVLKLLNLGSFIL